VSTISTLASDHSLVMLSESNLCGPEQVPMATYC
jgi:hypothetical protein